MSGRFDPTNILMSELSVITNVDFDHVPQLGATLEEIVWHKAGIINEANSDDIILITGSLYMLGEPSGYWVNPEDLLLRVELAIR